MCSLNLWINLYLPEQDEIQKDNTDICFHYVRQSIQERTK